MTLLAGKVVTAADIAVLLNKQVVEINPGGNLDATTSTVSFSDWIAAGTISVPVGAVTAYVTVSVLGVYDITGAGNDYQLKAQIGTATGVQVPVKGIGLATRLSIAWTSRITLTATGSLAFDIQAMKVAGAGQLRADGSSLVTAIVEFL